MTSEQKISNRFSTVIKRFFHAPFSGGVVLIACTVVALLLSNIDATSQWYYGIWHTNFTVGFEGFLLSKPFELWVNDALMALFFFVVGLEIKREIVAGELRSFSQASLPIAAAIGGMIVPALIYFFFNSSTPTQDGWGIPMATDIAFALGILSLMGRRVPISLKIFLTALAIVDDLGAILVIAIFYSAQLDWAMLIAAMVVYAFMLLLGSKFQVRQMRWYILPAVVLWVLFLFSGIHATIAGVLIAMTIPATAQVSKESFWASGHKLMKNFKHFDLNHVQLLNNDKQYAVLQQMRQLSLNTISPIQRLENSLHSVVMFIVMPLFALCNAGVVFSSSSVSTLASDQSLGIILGLVVGKPIGIILFSLLVIKLGVAVMPTGASWRSLVGVACLGGIGFTMSIFIDTLAFDDPSIIATGKIAILLASVLSAIIGVLILRFCKRLV